jgi:acylphosphatase
MSLRGFWLIALAMVSIASACAGPEPTTRSATRPATTQASGERIERRRVHVIVTGRVQGVGFRAFTQEQAVKLGVTGYVLNRSDGSVEAVAEGPAGAVSQLLNRLKRGPEPARVDGLRTTDETYRGEFADFAIRTEGEGRGG